MTGPAAGGEKIRAPGSLAPLYAAGFVTAFGAHSVASGLGVEDHNLGFSLLSFGLLLAVYDIAEVILKPVFGALSDRIGTKPVVVGGLLAFAIVSLAGVFATNLLLVGLARLGQGAAASAFSPAASATVARVTDPKSAGRYFGRYGSWKSLGYALGPLLAGALISTLGLPSLFIVLAIAAGVTAAWVVIAAPAPAVLPRQRYTVADLSRQLTRRSFVVPVAALAIGAAALGSAVGFLPVAGQTIGLGTLASVALVTVLAVTSAIAQPVIGRLRDRDRLSTRAGMVGGIALIAVSIGVAASLQGPAALYLSAALLGVGIGAVTSLGFAQLAIVTPADRMGRTMGTAELGREIGDAGGPLLVGAVAVSAGLAVGLAVLAAAAGLVAVVVGVFSGNGQPDVEPS